MRVILSLLLTATISCTNQQKENGPVVSKNRSGAQAASRSSDSAAVVQVVQDFFKAFDEKDLKKLDSLLLPTTMIIHYNGATTGTAEMLNIIRETKDWWPRTRKLSHYEFISNGNLSILGLMNEVTFSLPANKKVYEPYKETWIFEKMAGSWKPIRVHYSKVTVTKHSEEVQ